MSPEPFDSNTPRRSRRDLGALRQVFLWIGLLAEMVMIAAGLFPAVWLVMAGRDWATSPGHWVLLLLGAILLFNYGYLVGLLAFRLVLPRPREGFYPVHPGRRLPGQVIVYAMNLLLTKARYEPPWAMMFSSVLANTFPLRPLFVRWFGPRSKSLSMGDTIFMIDPCLVEIGRNVVLGFHCVIVGHLLDNRGLQIRKVHIEDGAVIGGETALMPGVRIGHHAVVAVRSFVPPGTVIGPYEYWSGSPAKKIKDLPREGESSSESTPEARGE
jgi:hypothetical protein